MKCEDQTKARKPAPFPLPPPLKASCKSVPPVIDGYSHITCSRMLGPTVDCFPSKFTPSICTVSPPFHGFTSSCQYPCSMGIETVGHRQNTNHIGQPTHTQVLATQPTIACQARTHTYVGNLHPHSHARHACSHTQARRPEGPARRHRAGLARRPRGGGCKCT